MKNKLYLIVLLVSIMNIAGYKSLAQEEGKLSFPISNLKEIITQSGVAIDTEVSSDGNGSLIIRVKEPIVVELFELNDKEFGNKRLSYRAQMRAEDLQAAGDMRGISYLELIAKFPDGEELISRGPRVPISGTTEWRPAETILYLDRGTTPERLKLNLIVEGEGTVWLDSVVLEAIPLRLNYLFWGHIVVWIVLIIYIYDLLRKNRQLKRELETL
ncbi:MAG: hypothetical protein KAJ31_08745 [Deltaproteobacteria bacterium]|nr:hypothetical protein [Deltaproteobacteria bacterium]